MKVLGSPDRVTQIPQPHLDGLGPANARYCRAEGIASELAYAVGRLVGPHRPPWWRRPTLRATTSHAQWAPEVPFTRSDPVEPFPEYQTSHTVWLCGLPRPLRAFRCERWRLAAQHGNSLAQRRGRHGMVCEPRPKATNRACFGAEVMNAIKLLCRLLGVLTLVACIASCSSHNAKGAVALRATPCPGPGTGAPIDHRTIEHVVIRNAGGIVRRFSVSFPWRVETKLQPGEYRVSAGGLRPAEVHIEAHQLSHAILLPDCG
jgi:hypothetical protein